MAKLQQHHITYDPNWEVEISWQMHRLIYTIQVTRSTEEQYARLTNFLHSITFEWNRIRQELDTGLDLRILKPKPKAKVKQVKGKTYHKTPDEDSIT